MLGKVHFKIEKVHKLYIKRLNVWEAPAHCSVLWCTTLCYQFSEEHSALIRNCLIDPRIGRKYKLKVFFPPNRLEYICMNARSCNLHGALRFNTRYLQEQLHTAFTQKFPHLFVGNLLSTIFLVSKVSFVFSGWISCVYLGAQSAEKEEKI